MSYDYLKIDRTISDRIEGGYTDSFDMRLVNLLLPEEESLWDNFFNWINDKINFMKQVFTHIKNGDLWSKL